MTHDEREAIRERNGYLYVDELPDGRITFIEALLFDQASLGIGDVDERYTFSTITKAWWAMILWRAVGFDGEPGGWHRHQPSNRRRPNGDPTGEYLAR